MNRALAVAGSGLVAVALLDLAWTTVAAGSGAGPVIERLAGRCWSAALATWIILVLAGRALLFSATDGAVRSTTTGAPADLTGRVYLAG